jgi:hypothetical protein
MAVGQGATEGSRGTLGFLSGHGADGFHFFVFFRAFPHFSALFRSPGPFLGGGNK